MFVHVMRIVQEPTLGHRVNTPCASNFSISAFQPFQPRMNTDKHGFEFAAKERKERRISTADYANDADAEAKPCRGER